MTPTIEIVIVGIVVLAVCALAYIRSKRFDDKIPFEKNLFKDKK